MSREKLASFRSVGASEGASPIFVRRGRTARDSKEYEHSAARRENKRTSQGRDNRKTEGRIGPGANEPRGDAPFRFNTKVINSARHACCFHPGGVYA